MRTENCGETRNCGRIVGVTKAVIDVRNFERDKEVWEKPENYVIQWRNLGESGICGRG